MGEGEGRGVREGCLGGEGVRGKGRVLRGREEGKREVLRRGEGREEGVGCFWVREEGGASW